MTSDEAHHDQPAEAPDAGPPPCLRCGKSAALCICDSVVPLDNKIEVLILQHPQEQDKDLGTARLAALHLKRSTHRIGLSWPSLGKILGRDADPQRWAVLYLGSANAQTLAPERELVLLDRKGDVVDNQDSVLRGLEGIILLDGTWSQAKALWWRNAWMLKCRRVILNPRHPSRYGKLRREPRRDGLSTIEAAGMLLARLEKRPDIEAALTTSFERMLARYREVAPSGPPRRDWRRHRSGRQTRARLPR